jgi:hypothetical protein
MVLGILCACYVSWLHLLQPTGNTHGLYKVLLVQHPLTMSMYRSKHVQVLNS